MNNNNNNNNNMEYDQKIIQEHFQKTPKIIQDILSDTWITDSILKISKEEKIRIDVTNKIIHLIVLTLIGLVKPENFSKIFFEDIIFEKEKGLKIIKKIEETVFNKVREIISQEVLKENQENEKKLKEAKKETIQEKDKHLTLEDLEHDEKYKHLTFKEKFELLKELNKRKETQKKTFDPYREPIE